MEFSYPVAIESYKFMVPKPGEESRLFGPVRPFQYPVSDCLKRCLDYLPLILNCHRYGDVCL